MLFKIDSFNIRGMKLPLIYFLLFVFFLPHCMSLQEPSDKKSSKTIKLERNKFKATPKKTQTKIKSQSSERWNLRKNKNSRKNLRSSKSTRRNQLVKAVSKKRLLAKDDILPKNYYKAKKNKKELREEFEKHLENFKQICEISEDKKELLTKQLNFFENFLQTSLRDFNMDYALQLLFSNIVSLFEETNENNFIDLDTFTRSYRMLYNLPEDLEINDYPDNWAQTIAQSLKCAQQDEEKN